MGCRYVINSRPGGVWELTYRSILKGTALSLPNMVDNGHRQPDPTISSLEHKGVQAMGKCHVLSCTE